MKTRKNFKFDADLIKKAEDKAAKERRSLTSWIEFLMEKEIESETVTQ